MRDFVFCVCPSDRQLAAAMAIFARDHLGSTRAAVLFNGDSFSSAVTAEIFAGFYEGRGGKVVFFEPYGGDQADLSGPLEVIAAAEPDLLYLPGQAEHAVLIAEQARRVGLDLAGNDGWMFLAAGREALVRGYFTPLYFWDDDRPAMVRFRNAFKDRYGAAPGYAAPLFYDAVVLLARAVEEAGSEDRGRLRDVLAELHDLDLATSPVASFALGDAVKPMPVLRVDEIADTLVAILDPIVPAGAPGVR